jgi:LCP family protein required for cell wall assembly
MRRLICSLIAAVLLLTAMPGGAIVNQERIFLQETISYLKPEEIPKTPQGIHHYLLICMDKWQNNPENPGYNDGLVILTLDEVSGRVIVTSLIRDMLVICPDGTPGRINRIIRLYGIQELLDTINSHFGLEIDKYVLMDWRHIMEIIDAAGGVDINLTSTEVNYLKGWSVPVGSTQPVLNVAGDYHLNGFAAVIYMRIRKRRASNDIDTQDFGRTFRVRTVLSNLAKGMRDADFNQAQLLLSAIIKVWDQPFDKGFTYEGIRNNGIFTWGDPPKDPNRKRYTTNISMLDLLEVTRIAFTLKSYDVEQWRLPADGTVKPYTYGSSAGQLVDFKKNRELLHTFMFPDNFIVAEETVP